MCRDVEITEIGSEGVYVQLGQGMQGFVPTAELDITHYPDLRAFRPGRTIDVKILEVSGCQLLGTRTHSVQRCSKINKSETHQAGQHNGCECLGDEHLPVVQHLMSAVRGQTCPEMTQFCGAHDGYAHPFMEEHYRRAPGSCCVCSGAACWQVQEELSALVMPALHAIVLLPK